MSEFQSSHLRKALPILPAAWLVIYGLKAFFLWAWIGELSTHAKIALFSTLIVAWWVLVLKLAPQVLATRLINRMGIVVLFICVSVVLSKLLRAGLAADPVWTELLRIPVAYLLPVIMLWIRPSPTTAA